MTNEKMQELYHKNIDTKDRVIFFSPWQPSEEMIAEDKSWEVNDFSAQNLIKGLYILDKQKKAPITIIWNSFGGEWTAGMAIYDFIKKIKSPVTMECYGHVRSMGTIILQACKKRHLSKHCEFMIHYGMAGMGMTHSKDFMANAKIIDKASDIMEDIYLKKIKEKNPKFTKARLKDLMKYDKFLTVKQAINLGLVDKII